MDDASNALQELVDLNVLRENLKQVMANVVFPRGLDQATSRITAHFLRAALPLVILSSRIRAFSIR